MTCVTENLLQHLKHSKLLNIIIVLGELFVWMKQVETGPTKDWESCGKLLKPVYIGNKVNW